MPKINFGDMEKIPEDTFFSWYIKNNYKFPAREFCEEFSSQKNFNENTFGTHQPKFKDFDEFKNIILNIYN